MLRLHPETANFANKHTYIMTTMKYNHKLNSLIAISLLSASTVMTGCQQSKASQADTDTFAIVDTAYYDSAISETPVVVVEPQVITNFRAGSKNVVLPSLEAMGLADSGDGVKSVAIIGLAPWGGLGSMAQQYQGFMAANSISQAKNYGDVLCEYSFDEAGRVTKATAEMVEYRFTYDDMGHPTAITVEEEGYRGEPSYKVRYTIAWDGDNATSISRKFLEYDPGMSEGTPRDEVCPFITDFSKSATLKSCNAMPGSAVEKRDSHGNWTKLSGNDETFWREIKYYK